MATRCAGLSATGTGSGVDWNNVAAWATVTISRATEDVIYIRKDTVPARDISIAEDGVKVITIKHATEADHGPATGWLSSMGDGPTIFDDGFVLEGGYYVIDGQVGGFDFATFDPDNDDLVEAFTTGHGFEVHSSDGAFGSIINILDGGTASHHWTLRRIKFKGPDGGGSDNGKPVGLRINNVSNSTFEDLYFTDMGSNCVFGWGVNNFFTRCFMGFFLATESNHGEACSLFGGTGLTNWRFRHCVFGYSSQFGTGGLMFANDGGSGGLLVDGCLFIPAEGELDGGNGLIGTFTDDLITDLKIIHCTFVGWLAPLIGILQEGDDAGSFKNNLLYDGSDYGNLDVLTCDGNHFVDAGEGEGDNITTGTGDPFVDIDRNDYRLTVNTLAGANLGEDTTDDMLGNSRLTGTRGAFEFTGESAAGGALKRSLNYSFSFGL
jgi:hypothetical protein